MPWEGKGGEIFSVESLVWPGGGSAGGGKNRGISLNYITGNCGDKPLVPEACHHNSLLYSVMK